jgi:hypothetical protein
MKKLRYINKFNKHFRKASIIMLAYFIAMFFILIVGGM